MRKNVMFEFVYVSRPFKTEGEGGGIKPRTPVTYNLI
jgi:hypothetical protein